MKYRNKISCAPTLKTLANEMSLFRSFIIGTVGIDSEGTYRPEFVEDVLTVSANARPVREFLNPNDFLRRIRSKA